MRIDDGGLKQAIRLQKAQTDLAKTVFERQERLWNEQIGSEIEYLQAKTNYESQRSQLGQLNDQLEKAIVRAPFSGKIDHIMVDVGQVVSPGTMPLIRLVSTKKCMWKQMCPNATCQQFPKGTQPLLKFLFSTPLLRQVFLTEQHMSVLKIEHSV